MPGRKWPWILFIIFGIGKISVNWATGQWTGQFVAVQLFSAAAMSEFYGPWVISASVPIGAVAFIIYKRTRLLRSHKAETLA